MARLSRLELIKELIYAGERAVVREGERHKIYLPKGMEALWRELEGRKVEVYLRIKDEG